MKIRLHFTSIYIQLYGTQVGASIASELCEFVQINDNYLPTNTEF